MPILIDVKKVDSKFVGTTLYEQGVELVDRIPKTLRVTGSPDVTEQSAIPCIERILLRRYGTEYGMGHYIRVTSFHVKKRYKTHSIASVTYELYRPAELYKHVA